MWAEFKEFINKGNVVGFAVAVIMAGAFGAVVTSFTGDILMPPLGLAMGGVDFSSLQKVLQSAEMNADGTVATPEVAIRYGKFLKFLIDFLIISFVLFLVVKQYNKAVPPPPPGPSQEDLLTEIRDALKK